MQRHTVLGLFGMAAVTGAAPATADQGQEIYQKTCVTCHGANGKSVLPGVPDFTTKGGVLSKSDDELLKHVVEGFQSPGSPMAMPPKGGNPALTEAQLRAALDYSRSAFGK